MLNSDPRAFIAMDIGEVSARTHIFNCIDGCHRYSGSEEFLGSAYGYDKKGMYGIGDTAYQSVITKPPRTIDKYNGLLLPGGENITGVESLIVSTNHTSVLKVIVVSLFGEIPEDHKRQITSLPQINILEIPLTGDSRNFETQLGQILASTPDVIMVYGLSEKKSFESIQNAVKPLRIAYFLSPEGYKPKVLFLGKKEDQESIKKLIKPGDDWCFIEMMNRGGDKDQLIRIYEQVQNIFRHLQTQKSLASVGLPQTLYGKTTDSSDAFGRLVQNLHKNSNHKKNVIGLYFGNLSTTIALSDKYNRTFISISSEDFLSHENVLQENKLFENVARRIHSDISDETIKEYIHNKYLYPSYIPVTEQEIEIELAFACVCLQTSVKNLVSMVEKNGLAKNQKEGSCYGLILIAGNPVNWSLGFDQIIRLVLEGLQPVGISTLIVDQYDISHALGALARTHPEICKSILSSDKFLHLGTVISLMGDAPPGATILKIRAIFQDQKEIMLDIQKGEMHVIPLEPGKSVRMQIQPLYAMDFGMGAGVGGSLQIEGSEFGIIIDGRGRPLKPRIKEKFGGKRKTLIGSLYRENNV